jgi:hypothetical protein
MPGPEVDLSVALDFKPKPPIKSFDPANWFFGSLAKYHSGTFATLSTEAKSTRTFDLLFAILQQTSFSPQFKGQN